jgi:signal transduction histidine kinase
VEPSSKRGRRLLVGAFDRVNGLLAAVSDLLDLAKIREGRTKKAAWNQDINLNQMLSDLFDSLGTFAKERQVKLISRLEQEILLAWGISTDLSNAFENLIHNSIKYSHPGGKVVVRLESTDNEAVVRVTDDGIGIPEDSAPQVFLEFVRAPNAKRHASEGTGLGLTIVKEAVEGHGGTVSVQSREGIGSTFSVTLPLRHTPPEVA